MAYVNITEYIPEDRFITRRELRFLTGLSDRSIRNLISKARRNGAWIVSNVGHGGYKKTKDSEEWHEFVKMEARRAVHTFKIAYSVEGQLSLDDILKEEANK